MTLLLRHDQTDNCKKQAKGMVVWVDVSIMTPR
jgi:hypothetical protein